jgi:hypothetical protein
VRADVESWSAAIEHASRAWVTLIACAAGGAALAWHSFTTAGADDSGYLSQALLWAQAWREGLAGFRDLLRDLPQWPLTPEATAALGWRPGVDADWQVPTYPPGLPLLMAVPMALGGIPLASTVVVVSAGLAVWAAGSLAREAGGPSAGIVASALLAASPIFLFQAFQPMSDVPVTAAWMLCWWHVQAAHPVAAGASAAVAVLIRPNLGPLAIVPLTALLRASSGRVVSRRGSTVLAFAAPVLAAAALIAWLQWRWYGSPLTSGYGDAANLFAWANVAPNAARYTRWLWETQPVLVLAPLALAVSTPTGSTALRWGLALFAAATVGAYLIYGVFDEWSYLRFLLPAIAALAVLTGVAAARLLSLAPSPWRALAAAAGAFAIVMAEIAGALSHGAFSLAQDHGRARLAGAYLAAALPPGSVVVAAQQSGSMRLLTGHPIVRWDLIAGNGLAAAIATLDTYDREVWWVLDEDEVPLVRARFTSSAWAALDWPPRLQAGSTARTMAWRVGDRASFLAGARIPTDRLR